MKRLAEFLRSVIPADPAQLLFLAGIVCFIVAPRLRWWPPGLGVAPERLADSFVQQAQTLGIVFLQPILFAGVAGYCICFWPGNRPFRRILWLVFFPTMVGLGLIFSRLIYLSAPSSSVLEGTGSLVAHKMSWAWSLPWRLLPGFHFCLIGLLLTAIYTSRIGFGIAALPLSLPGNPASTAQDTGSWRRVQFLIWVLVGPLFLLYSLFTFITLLLPAVFTSRLPFYSQSAWFSRLSPVLGALFVFAILLWIMGKGSRQVICKAAGLPEPRYVALGLAFPIGIAVLLSTGQYLVDRSQWAAHDFGRFSPPQFRTYFDLPDPWLLLAFFPALFEEMIFRGLLQRRFVQRYGIYRGIFLVGIVWAAFHFVSDVSFSRLTETDVLLKLSWRILFCLALSYVLGWLTLRFGSILPAAIAHTFYNILVMSGFGPPFIGKDTVLVALWAVLAWALFRYWPVSAEDESKEATPEVTPEPAL
jgi:membrane protease YdiL (CAAX protease family)